VLLDLDDTLFLQSTWLDGAWAETAQAASAIGVDAVGFEAALRSIAAQGTAAGGIIDRALAAVGADQQHASELVQVFRSHRPTALPLLPGVAESLERVRASVPIGLVTDGDAAIQRGKIEALGLEHAFDAVVLSDELGRDRRKPHPAPFEAVLAILDVAPDRAVYVGDNPDKDVAGAVAVGMAAVRVRTGEYGTRPNPVEPLLDVADVVVALDGLLAQMTSGARIATPWS
jgi:putative hydrolase of the HAD superfamily